jgi:deazaflavin-dependent oxidoreductase (nitroreductase family)
MPWPGRPGYVGADLVADAAGVLDAYRRPVAPIVGVAAGGAIAPLLALDLADRVLSPSSAPRPWPLRRPYAGRHAGLLGEACMIRTTIRGRFLCSLKNTLNRVTSRMARSGHGPFSLIRHVGRKSGRSYETPVILVQVPEGFIAELTYGENVDWYHNIVATGGCVVVHHGREYRVTHIEPCSPEYGRGAYAPPFRLILRATGRKEFRLLRTDKSDGTFEKSTGGGAHRPPDV